MDAKILERNSRHSDFRCYNSVVIFLPKNGNFGTCYEAVDEGAKLHNRFNDASTVILSQGIRCVTKIGWTTG